jgi:hypothetical protein
VYIVFHLIQLLLVYQSFLTQIFFRYLCFYSVVINVASLQKGEPINRKNVLHDQLAETKIFLRRFKSFEKGKRMKPTKFKKIANNSNSSNVSH